MRTQFYRTTRASADRDALGISRGFATRIFRQLVSKTGLFVAVFGPCCLLPLTASAGQAPGPQIVENVARFDFDGGTRSESAFFTLVPAVDPAEIQLSDDTLAENDDGAAIGTIVANNFGTIISYTVDDQRFEVVGGVLRVKPGRVIDFESEPVISLILTVTDDEGPVNQVVDVTVTDVNEAPFGLVVDNNYVPAGDDGGPVVGELAVDDVDAGDSHTFSVEADDRFVVDGTTLLLAQGVALGVDETVAVTVIATDSGGLTTTLVVEVTTDPGNVDRVPTPSLVTLLQPGTQGEPVDIPTPACESPDSFGVRRAAPARRQAALSGPVLVAPAEAFAIGDPIIVRVADADQNIDPLISDQISVLLSVASTLDSETLVLKETGPDTGVFVGYVDSTSSPSMVDDCILTVSSRGDISALYVDPDDPGDTSDTSAPIAPVGIVFDDESGEPIDGIILVLVDVNKGGPAIVLGDGPAFAIYPSAIKSGQAITDAAGLSYPAAAGEYRFPAVPAGDYRIEVFNEIAYDISVKSDEELRNVGSGNYTLRAGSRGGVFHVQDGSLPQIDIPLRRLPERPEVVTPSEIEFMQYSTNPAVGSPFDVGATMCVGDGQRQVSELRDVSVPVPGRINLVHADVFKAGQPIFVKVRDTDQNKNPALIERIVIELMIPASDDVEFLELQETGPDTGEFIGYVQSTEDATPVGDCRLTVVKNESIQTVYTDAYDNTDVSDSIVLVDPFGVVFSTRDGMRLDGVTVTLIDVATGEPATVFGDGPAFAAYPSTVVTGTTAVDDAGGTYDFPVGEFRFPFVEPGQYRLLIEDLPEDHFFPSTASLAHIEQLDGGPYAIAPGSRGGIFEVPVGPALHIDIPVDPVNNVLFLTKGASKTVASVGEFIQFKIDVANQAGISASGVTVVDTLPRGFRYQRGSLHVAGSNVEDPAIGPEGRELRISLTAVASGAPLEVSYVTEVTAGTPLGEAVNTVTAQGNTVADANVAVASVLITEELMRSKAVLLGRVFYGPCDAAPDARVGLGGARVLIEDGTTVLSDSDGNWHIEGVAPGTHVVQLDIASLPLRYEVVNCEENTRFAGRNFSQFVDVQGGSLWRADFYVQDAPDPEADIEITQTVTSDEGGAAVFMRVKHDGSVELDDLNIFYRAPAGWRLDYESVRVNGVNQPPIESISGVQWQLGVLGEQDINFRITPKTSAVVKEPASRGAAVAPSTRGGVASPKVATAHPVTEKLTFRSQFTSGSALLGAADIEALAVLSANLRMRHVLQVTITGHSDNVPMAPRNRGEFVDNYVLSKARAEAVAQALSAVAGIDEGLIRTAGVGADRPIASNENRAGRLANRRVEIEVTSAAPVDGLDRQMITLNVDTVVEGPLQPATIAALEAAIAPYQSRSVRRVDLIVHGNKLQPALTGRAMSMQHLLRERLGNSQVELVQAGVEQPLRPGDQAPLNHRMELLITADPVAAAAKPKPVAKAPRPVLSRALVRFRSQSTPKGKTETISVDMAEVLAKGEAGATGVGKAKGSWEKSIVTSGDPGADSPTAGIMSLKDGGFVSRSTVAMRVMLNSELLPHVYIEGREVGRERLGVTIQNPNTGMTTYTYLGVEIGDEPGKRQVLLRGEDREGALGFEQAIVVWRTGEIESMRLVGVGENIADGQTPVVAYIQLLDSRQRPVMTNVELEITGGELKPYTQEDELRQFDIKRTVSVSSNGAVRFDPVTRAGVYRVRLDFGDVGEDIEIPVSPAKREWVLVGLAEGVVGLSDVNGNARDVDPDLAEDYYDDGRLAFYAKGQVLGQYLLTLSYDTDKRQDNSIFQKINPGTYYTLYGDASTRSFDAASNEKLFVRVEGESFNTTLGDFSTNLSVTELGAYNRSLTGLYGEFYGDRVRASGFAAETAQSFVRTEMQGNGTSGVYRLRHRGIVVNSERIRLETRDRFQNTEVVETRALTRGLDYNIDYSRGSLIFKQPIFSQDEAFNPVFVVAEYETDGAGEEDLVAGGRVGVFFDERKGEVGATYVKDGTAGREQELAGADVVYRFSETTELRAEVAQTKSQSDAVSEVSGTAYKVEFEHQSGSLDVSASLRDQDAGFGIGQQGDTGAGTRQAGVNARYKISEDTRVVSSLNREEDKSTGRTRDVVQTAVVNGVESDSVALGVVSSVESGGGQPDAESLLAQLTARRQVLDGKASLRGTLDAPLDTSDSSEAYPTRLGMGADYSLSDNVKLRGEQEFSFSDLQDTQTTRIGLAATPWAGGEAITSVQQGGTENADNMFANFGLRQVWAVNEKWTVDFGVDRSQTLRQGVSAPVDDQVNPNAVPVRGNEGGDFTALFSGASYRTEVSEWVGRVESRQGQVDDQWAFVGGYKRDLRDGVVVASLFDLRSVEAVGRSTLDGRLGVGLAYRPAASAWSLLNKLELVSRNEKSGSSDLTTRKIVNNLNANYKPDGRTQIGLQYAFKYVLDSIDGQDFSGYTDLVGAEVRRNLSDRWDIGLNASILHSWNSGIADFAYGISLGHQFATNAWASIGYNFEGFRDDDFDESDYTTKGVYLKFRFKFDQKSARQIFRRQDVLD